MQVLDHNDEILVDETGYKQFIDELEKLKIKSLTIASKGSESYKDAVGDGWHDNFDFEESMRESRTIAKRIESMMLDKNKIKVICECNKNKNIVNINDTVKVEMVYSENDKETAIIKLTGKYIPSDDNEITLNSPLGRAIFKNKIGTVNRYKVNDMIIEIKIIEKLV